MRHRILASRIQDQHDVVAIRRRARDLSNLLDFDQQDQVRIATAVSEIARNAFEHGGGGEAEFAVLSGSDVQLEIVIRDWGKGVQALKDILEGTYESSVGLGVGLIGAKRLMDDFSIDSGPNGGAVITLRKRVRRSLAITPEKLRSIADHLAAASRTEPFQEMQLQNQELLSALEALNSKHEELEKLNEELENTNRGVVALYAELDEKAEALKKASLAKTRFLSNITHEFRTPLGAIVTLTNCLLDGLEGPLTKGQAEVTTTIRRSSEELLELVNDLLDIAKVEAGKIPVKIVDFSLRSFLSSLQSAMKPVAERVPEVQLIFEPTPDVEMSTDSGKLTQVLRNFISNALKFTSQGSVTVTAETDGTDHVSISVKDTGIGIRPENLESIFEEFVQIESKQQTRHKGTGLGLSLTQKLVQLLGGKIQVRSEFGKGSTFSIRLPRKYTGPRIVQIIGDSSPQPSHDKGPSPDAPTFESVPEKARPGIHREDEPRFLIVDDEPEERSFLRQALLSLYGGDVREAGSGPEALNLLRDFTPNVVFLDLNLPQMDGFEIYHRIREYPEWRSLPVVIHSSKPLRSGDRDRLQGVIKYFSKLEFSEEQLLDELQQLGRQLDLTPRQTDQI